jgi:hypothetical protein
MENLPNQTISAKEKAKDAARAIKAKMVAYVGAGLGLVIGLAWNDAIIGLIGHFYPDKGDGVIAKLVYAVIITVVVGLVLYLVEKSLEEDKK